MNPQIASKINPLAVRISLDRKPCGSGVLCSNNEISFVITAKHVVVNDLKQNEILSNLNIDFKDSEKGGFKNRVTIKPNDIVIHPEYDLAILRLEEHFEGVECIKIPSKLPYNQSHFFFQGFPIGLGSKELKIIDCQYDHEESHIISLKTADNLESNDNVASGNVDNFSGSGLFVEFANDIFLCGIVESFEKIFQNFKAVKLNPSSLIELLKQAGVSNFDFSDLPEIHKNNLKEARLSKAILQQRLDNIDKLLVQFKAKTAFSDLQSLEIQIKNLSPIDTELLARCNYLTGWAKFLLGYSIDETNDSFLQASTLSDNLIYKEREAQILLSQYKDNEALDLANHLLIETPENPVGWAIKNFLSKSSDSFLCQNTNYITTILIGLERGVDSNIVEAGTYDTIFLKLSEGKKIPLDIHYSNIQLWAYYGQYVFLKDKKGIVQLENYLLLIKDNPNLNYAKQIFDAMLEKTSSDEVKDNTMLQLARFYGYLIDYLVKPTKKTAFKLYEAFGQSKLKNNYPFLQFHMVGVLFNEKEIGLIMELITLIEEDKVIPEIYLSTSIFCQKDFLMSESLKYFKLYLINVKVIDSNNVGAIVNWLDLFYSKGTTLNELLDVVSSTNNDTDEKCRKLLLASVYRHEEIYDSEIKQLLPELEECFKEKETVFQGIISVCHYSVEGFFKAKSHIETYWDKVDKSLITRELILYIEVLTATIAKGNGDMEDSIKLLELFKHWRNSFPIEEKYLKNETELRRVSKNYEVVEELTNLGLEKFGGEYFKVQQILALCNLSRHNDISAKINLVFNDSLLNEEFSLDSSLEVVKCCLDLGKYELGSELFYRLVKRNPDNKSLRSKFAFNEYFIGEGVVDLFPNPTVVEVECYVDFTLDGIKYFEQVNLDNISDINIKSLLGRKIDEQYQLTDFNSGRQTTIKIRSIYNKYLGLKREIIKDIDSNNRYIEGITKLKFEYKDDGMLDFEKFKESVQNHLGSEGTKQALLSEEIISRYEKREIGFLNILSLFKNPIDAYNFIRKELYFPILPVFRHATDKINSSNQFVLDFSSLLLFFSLDNERNIDFESLKLPFIISPSLYDFVYDLIKKEDRNREENYSLNVTLDRVVPIVKSEEKSRSEKQELEELERWMKKYCKIENLDNSSFYLGSLNNQDDSQNRTIFKETFLLSQAENRFAISDDISLIKVVPNLVSTELFLKTFFPEKHNELVERLLMNGYRGLTVTKENLHYLFRKNPLQLNDEEGYKKALSYSLSGWNPNPQNLRTVIDFVIDFYQTEFELEYKRFVSRNIFYSVFKDKYITIEKSLSEIIEYLDIKLQLQQYYKELIIEDIKSLLF